MKTLEEVFLKFLHISDEPASVMLTDSMTICHKVMKRNKMTHNEIRCKFSDRSHSVDVFESQLKSYSLKPKYKYPPW